jgi:hypothetical protein
MEKLKEATILAMIKTTKIAAFSVLGIKAKPKQDSPSIV